MMTHEILTSFGRIDSLSFHNVSMLCEAARLRCDSNEGWVREPFVQETKQPYAKFRLPDLKPGDVMEFLVQTYDKKRKVKEYHQILEAHDDRLITRLVHEEDIHNFAIPPLPPKKKPIDLSSVSTEELLEEIRRRSR